MGKRKTKYSHSIRNIFVDDFLSFDDFEIGLEPLNIVVGPNGSGKSNLIETLMLMRSAAGDLPAFVRRSSGIAELLRKGADGDSARIVLYLEIPGEKNCLIHDFRLAGPGPDYRVIGEIVLKWDDGVDDLIYRNIGGKQNIKFKSKEIIDISNSKINEKRSVLSQRRDSEFYPELTSLSDAYDGIRVYRDWSFGRQTVFREPQRADMRNDYLEEDFSNLGLILNRLRRSPKAKGAILAHLRDLYDGLDDFDVSIEGGTVQVFLTEGEHTIPATRLSDGTLRYLCLLAILCDPDPAPITCIEEPELGLHPDVLPKLANLLVEASGRTQLIVTTHSDILIDAMTDRPESVLVCDKVDGVTTMKRLSSEDLGEWLKEYRLGDLWLRGKLGGTRW